MADIEYSVSLASVIANTVDPTLKNAGEAADAKAVGDALKLKASLADVPPETKVNSVDPDDDGNIEISGEDVPLSATDETSIKAKIDDVDSSIDAINDSISEIEDSISEHETEIEGKVTAASPKFGSHTSFSEAATSDITLTLPTEDGTIARTADIPSFKIGRGSASIAILDAGATATGTIKVSLGKTATSVVPLGCYSSVSACAAVCCGASIDGDNLELSYTVRNYTSSGRTSPFNVYVSYYAKF